MIATTGAGRYGQNNFSLSGRGPSTAKLPGTAVSNTVIDLCLGRSIDL